MYSRLDAIIFGASGFTGKYVVEHAVEIFHDLRWGIAGRNKAKLEAVLKGVSAKVNKNLDNIPIIIADVDDERSIQAMSAKCKIVLNCCGPYHLYGEVVVKSCIEAGTHHIDITGEPKFIAEMQLKYSEMAKAKSVYVVSACGFECIPAELGLVYVEKQYPGTLNSVEMYAEVEIERKDGKSKAIVNSGSWDSLIYIFSNPLEMMRSQKQLDRMLGANAPTRTPKLSVKPYIQKPAYPKGYFLPFPATDFFVVQQSQRLRHSLEGKIPTQFQSYIGFPSLLVALLLPLVSLVYLLLAQCSCTRKLLIKYPEVFTMGFASSQGPTPETAEDIKFKMTLKAMGWFKGQPTSAKPETKMFAQASGTNHYASTAVCMLYCAQVILNESDKMPQRGGVIPPGAAFVNTSLLEKLPQHKYGIKFEVL